MKKVVECRSYKNVLEPLKPIIEKDLELQKPTVILKSRLMFETSKIRFKYDRIRRNLNNILFAAKY